MKIVLVVVGIIYAISIAVFAWAMKYDSCKLDDDDLSF